MLEVHDELMTPGCPQCAVKHLSAALFHVAAGNLMPKDVTLTHPSAVHVAIAAINLVEVRAGYLSHLWYAVGALVRAEELAVPACGDVRRVARETRLMLEERGVEAVVDALRNIATSIWLTHADWAMAHLDEAVRELPDFGAEMLIDDLAGSIERVREEFFPEAPVASAEDEERGGEEAMATKKAAKKAPAFLKKEDPKAKKAACKGGKCKGKKC